jgi:DNA-binding response OmpR family regulator
MATTTLIKNVSGDFGTRQLLQPNAMNITGFKKLLGIGPKSEMLCNKMLSNGYLSIAQNDYNAAEKWLNERALNNRSLPDAIIYDVDIVGDDAFRNITKFKKTAYGERVPIILITSKTDEVEKGLALRAGADDYYSKEVSVEDLNYRIMFLRKLNEIISNLFRKGGFKRLFSGKNLAH